ncbi:hypothetical protein E3U44_03745 [Nitrosococcus wardiae]|uniref:Uncharacterized protein n=1 Tax=Nitrosococcus wardiae TaxID=1814290 RepID=A0A4P7BWW4_9GAMM|nr:hypothetical protein E3U44_03745 [Nitrosococcus wardiae]
MVITSSGYKSGAPKYTYRDKAFHDRGINAAKNVLRSGTAGNAGTDKARGAVETPRAVVLATT